MALDDTRKPVSALNGPRAAAFFSTFALTVGSSAAALCSAMPWLSASPIPSPLWCSRATSRAICSASALPMVCF